MWYFYKVPTVLKFLLTGMYVYEYFQSSWEMELKDQLRARHNVSMTKLSPCKHWDLIWELVCVLGAPFLIQLPAVPCPI